MALPGYAAAVERLERLVNYELSLEQPYTAENYDLARFRRFLEQAGAPQEKFPAIHVAGTKGKGSTCLIAEKILLEHGLAVGTYLSPHIESYRERVRVNGEDISEKDFAAAMAALPKPLPDDAPTHFEMLTALAFKAFEDVDVAVLEVGLGGRLDATNVCRPLVSVVTPIGIEHAEILGSDIKTIAREKAGIIRPGVPVVTAATGEALEIVAATASAPLLVHGKDFRAENVRAQNSSSIVFDMEIMGKRFADVALSLAGAHQAVNAAVATAACRTALEKLGKTFSEQKFRAALQSIEMRGRVQVASESPPVVLDTAHTPESAAALAGALALHFPGVKFVFVVALMRDKNAAGFFEMLAPVAAGFVATETNHPRVAPAAATAAAAERTGLPVEIEPEPATAFAGARRGARAVCAAGSFYLLEYLADLVT